MRLGLATASHLPELDEDGPALLAALTAEGLAPEIAVWDDPAVDWDAFDLVVVRTTWDYWLRHEEFLTWTRRMPRLLNSADVIAWNTDKRYLRALADLDVPVVPTSWFEPGDDVLVPSGPYVVKPVVSAGARDTAAFSDGSGAAFGQALLAAGRPVMVQPYVPGVDVEGETSVLLFDGVVSHGARKGAILRVGEGVQDVDSRSYVTPREPSDEQVAVAHRVVAAAQELTGSRLLYARVDLVPGPDGPQLLELEVTEPSLFLRHAPGAAERFAAVVRAAAERLPSTAGPS